MHIYIYEPGFRTSSSPPIPPLWEWEWGWQGWAQTTPMVPKNPMVSPNNPNGSHGLHKWTLRTPTQLRPILSIMGHLCLCCIHVNSWIGCRMTV